MLIATNAQIKIIRAFVAKKMLYQLKTEGFQYLSVLPLSTSYFYAKLFSIIRHLTYQCRMRISILYI